VGFGNGALLAVSTGAAISQGQKKEAGDVSLNAPLAVDLFCGLGGWTDGLLAEGYFVVGFDIERHHYGDAKYPAQLILQDVLTLHGRQFKDAALIVASPPCQEFSYMAMPWSRAKAIAAEYRAGVRDVKKLTALFDACFRIQREAIEAAGHFIPLVVENVRGANEWVGRSRWNCGSMHFWGDVPALMPMARHIKEPVDPTNRKKTGGWFYDNYETSHRRWSSKSLKRKAWSAQIAKVPLELSTWVARCFKPI